MMAKDFLIEFDHEMRQTRRLLERLPDDKLTFRPHPRSKALGALALHIAGIPSWTTNLLDEDSYDLAPDLAQFAVYLRMLDVPVPALYGPSADEN